MRVIGILNSKGGSSKTTLTTCLAVRASRDSATAVVDLDPQSSYSEWYARRGSPDNPALLLGEDRASDAVEALELTSPYDFVFIDGPTNALLVTEDAVKASTFVIVPMKPSTLDFSASRDCISYCQDEGKPFMAVISDKGPQDGRLVDEALGVLKDWKVPVAKTVIAHRVAYIDALTTGRTGPEKDRRAAAEVDSLWSEIQIAMRKAKVRR
jgi:chromosome partitioning protein